MNVNYEDGIGPSKEKINSKTMKSSRLKIM